MRPGITSRAKPLVDFGAGGTQARRQLLERDDRGRGVRC